VSSHIRLLLFLTLGVSFKSFYNSHSLAMLVTGEFPGFEVITSSGKIHFNQILIIQTQGAFCDDLPI